MIKINTIYSAIFKSGVLFSLMCMEKWGSRKKSSIKIVLGFSIAKPFTVYMYLKRQQVLFNLIIFLETKIICSALFCLLRSSALDSC